eukprot:1188715-Prorocentrum_minimum.AAC.4
MQPVLLSSANKSSQQVEASEGAELRGGAPGPPAGRSEDVVLVGSLRSAGPEIRPGVGARPGNVKEGKR